MLTRLLVLIIFVFVMACQTPSDLPPAPLSVASGQVLRYDNFPSQFVNARNVDIWLPDGYDAHAEYPVLYMHDGQMLFDSTTTWNKQEWMVDEIMGRLIEEQKIPACIVVGIWNGDADRHADYFPQKPFESLPIAYRDSLLELGKRDGDMPLFSKAVQSDAYLRFIVEELKPYIDSTFATAPDQSNTFIAGSSMGGLISMYAQCEYPEVFAGAACLSTHWVGIFETENNPIPAAFVAYMKQNLPDPANHRFYFDYGTETLDALYEPYQLMVDTVMIERGYAGSNWQSLKFAGKDHSERAWQERLHIPLEFLLKK
jgi:enterochelin esterase-like enzyme